MVAKSEPISANNKVLFTVFKLKILLRCERIFRLWKISAIDIVKNAIVMPYSLFVIDHSPVSRK